MGWEGEYISAKKQLNISSKEIQEEIDKQNEDFIKSITIKPTGWKEEMEEF